MFLDLFKLVLLFGGIVVLAPLGPVWTAAAVGIAFGGQSLVKIGLVVYTDKLPMWPLASAVLRPLAACGVMAATVLAVGQGLVALDVDSAGVRLALEIATGVVAYVAAAFVVARPIARDFLQLLRRALARGG
jgi:hypothetical protein